MASRVDDDEIFGGGDTIGGSAMGRLDTSRKSGKSKNQTINGHLGKSINL